MSRRRAPVNTARKFSNPWDTTPNSGARSWRVTNAEVRMSLTTRLSLIACMFLVFDGASADEPKVSRPGEYRGYSAVRFDGYQLTSRYVAVRDGTRLAI